MIPLLLVEKLSVRYGDVQVLWDVDLDINPGEIVALVGSNGGLGRNGKYSVKK
jgi:branched-chain amino acid transport system ATP-binding protein